MLFAPMKLVNRKCLVKNTPMNGTPDKPTTTENNLNIPHLLYNLLAYTHLLDCDPPVPLIISPTSIKSIHFDTPWLIS